MSNAADEARRLANLFSDMAQSVDAYRTQHFEDLTPDERTLLEDCIQRLDDVHDQFTATAIQAALDSIQADLGRIISITAQAQQSLKHLGTAAEIAKLASAAAELGMGIVAGDYGAVADAVHSVAQTLTAENSTDGRPLQE